MYRSTEFREKKKNIKDENGAASSFLTHGGQRKEEDCAERKQIEKNLVHTRHVI